MGNPNRDDRIYGVYSETTVASHIVPALPASCILPVSVTQPAVVEDSSISASGEDLAVTFLLPSEYHGVVIGAEGSVYGSVVRIGSEFGPATCNAGVVVEGSVEAHSGFVP